MHKKPPGTEVAQGGEGVQGSYFFASSFLTRLSTWSTSFSILDRRFSMFAATPPPVRDISPASLEVWIATCASCHAANGSVSTAGRAMQPPPPDFRRSSVSHERALKIITEGYPGTGMPAYRNQPAAVREDLAIISNSYRASHAKQ